MNTKSPNAATALQKILGPFTFGMFMIGSRTTLDLTQIQLAKKLGISRSALCEIEKGRTFVSPETAIRYAKKVGFSVDVALESCLNDYLRRAKIKKRVKLIGAA